MLEQHQLSTLYASEGITVVKNEQNVERLSDAWRLCEDSDHVGCKLHHGIRVFGHSIIPNMLKRRGRVVGSHTEGPNIYTIPVIESNLGEDFGEFLDSGKGADVTFEVDEKIFWAHKLVFSTCSPIFKAMLHFIYRDVLSDMHELIGSNSPMTSTSMPYHLLVAADQYGLDKVLSSLLQYELALIVFEEDDRFFNVLSQGSTSDHIMYDLKDSFLDEGFILEPVNDFFRCFI
ncbi:uncharacterized protein LOC131858287 [Cryptomeria japonica]|uniref:uncharacterized protein LOC131858287 n=1 Tax=Cryptomeria japonica TaxID=3369 RepID=UPI0027DA7658|nr:uncharacterized protein LOC131858287 [Cryptomeria japonica]